MTDDLVQRLREVGRDGTWKSRRNPTTAHPMCIKAADRIEALEAEIERLREWGLKAYTIVEWACGEGFLLPDPHFDCDDTLLEAAYVLGVETSEQARAALQEQSK